MRTACIPFGLLTFLCAILLGACRLATSTPSPPPTAVVSQTPADSVLTPTPVPSPTSTLAPSPTNIPIPSPTAEPRTLTICMGAEPDNLYLYGGSMLAQRNVLAAIYDGPIDNIGYQYQAVILEKLPSFADGDAVLQTAEVSAGDWIVDADGVARQLAKGVSYRPAGCRLDDCAQTYTGGQVEMDQLVARFSLLENLKWADGQPLTAADSVFSFEIANSICDRYWEPAPSACGYLGSGDALEKTQSYTAFDGRTVEWVGYPGYLDPTYFTNFAHPLPVHKLGDQQGQDLLNDMGGPETLPLGWGPYRITEWRLGHEIRLERNPYYFRADEGLPYFDRLVFLIVGIDDEKNIASLRNGTCDLLDLEASSQRYAESLMEFDLDNLVQTYFTVSNVWEHLDFGIQPTAYDDGYQLGIDRPDFFSDVRTRQGIAHCIDRQAIVEEILYGRSEVLHTYLVAAHPLFNTDVARYPYEPETGKVLLEGAGWIDHDGDPTTPRIAQGATNVPDGTPLSFSYWTTTSTPRQAVAKLIKESLGGCGVEVELAFFPLADFFAPDAAGPVFGRRFDLAQFAWLIDGTPPCDLYLSANIPGPLEAVDAEGNPRFPMGWEGVNNAGFSSQEFDLACETALGLLPGEAGYEEFHHLAQEIFARSLPVIPLYGRVNFTVSRPGFCGYKMDPTAGTDMWNIEEFNFGSGCP